MRDINRPIKYLVLIKSSQRYNMYTITTSYQLKQHIRNNRREVKTPYIYPRSMRETQTFKVVSDGALGWFA